jgi:hypothetical protein
LEEAIKLEDDAFVNPWNPSLWENDEDLNMEAMRKFLLCTGLSIERTI